MNHAKASACCFGGRRCGGSNTSAERSAAREDGVGPSATFRVASPLVMAMRGSCVECNSVRLTRRWVIASQATTACFAGGSATRNAHRRRSRMLRLRCAPPSAMSNVIHARASESGHLKRSFGSAPKRISAPEDSLRGELARARARQEPRSSACCLRGRRCGGSLSRGSHQSEGAARAALERSKYVASACCFGGRRCGGSLWLSSRQSEQRRRSRTAGSPRRQLRALKLVHQHDHP